MNWMRDKIKSSKEIFFEDKGRYTWRVSAIDKREKEKIKFNQVICFVCTLGLLACKRSMMGKST